MSRHHYSRALSRIARNSAILLQEDNLGSKVDLPALLSVSGSAQQVNEFVTMFKQWFLTMNPTEPAKLFLFGGIMHHPPLMVAATLNQFADTVDQILDVASIFEHAASVLETYGWIQGEVGDYRSGTCMMGAIDFALAQAEVTDQRYRNRALPIWNDINAVLREQLQTSLLVDWNDDPSRTKADVVNLLRQSAAAVRTVNL